SSLFVASFCKRGLSRRTKSPAAGLFRLLRAVRRGPRSGLRSSSESLARLSSCGCSCTGRDELGVDDLVKSTPNRVEAPVLGRGMDPGCQENECAVGIRVEPDRSSRKTRMAERV